MRLIDADKLIQDHPLICSMSMKFNLDLAPTVDIESIITGETSDGYHTFNELYHHRAVLFSVIVKAFPNNAWKAKKHHDGTMYDGMFIVGINTPNGQATYHYDIDMYWDMFECKELEYAPEWDGHTPDEAVKRIEELNPIKELVSTVEQLEEQIILMKIQMHGDCGVPEGVKK